MDTLPWVCLRTYLESFVHSLNNLSITDGVHHPIIRQADVRRHIKRIALWYGDRELVSICGIRHRSRHRVRAFRHPQPCNKHARQARNGECI